jgi:hypothetical protein
MTGSTHHAALVSPHNVEDLPFKADTEGKVDSKEEPCLASLLDDGLASAVGQRIGVVGIVNGVGRSSFVMPIFDASLTIMCRFFSFATAATFHINVDQER